MIWNVLIQKRSPGNFGMDTKRHIFLTGATGLIGRYLLHGFLSQECAVTVLVRPNDRESGRERIEKVLDPFRLSSQLIDRLQVIEGELPDFQPDLADRKKIASCDRVVHSAASLSFHNDSRNEPWLTNVDGTESLLKIATSLGLRRWIHISTAYVCGLQQGNVFEEPQTNSEAQNHYEASKRRAEELVRSQSGLNWTILRPGIVVGDSQTGFTSTYQGIYRCLQSVAFLAKRIQTDENGIRNLPLRFALSGSEQTNLVPVDWVSDAITQLSLLSDSSNKHIHLTTETPISTTKLVDAVQKFYGLTGIEFVSKNTELCSDRNVFERLFDRETKLLGPYFQNDPQFDRTHVNTLLPDLKDVLVDGQFINKLLTFAEFNQWGKSEKKVTDKSQRFSCKEFFEVYFPEAAAASQLVRIHDLNALLGFEVTGEYGGLWICQIVRGNVVSIKPVESFSGNNDFHYRTDTRTLEQIVQGQISARDAFFEQRIDIHGDIERALLLSLLLEDLLQEIPYNAETSGMIASERACV